jgi:hypothetical protein
MSTWTDEERTVVLDEQAMAAAWLLAGLTKVPINEVASNLVIVGAEESLRRGRLINEMRGDS